MNHRVSLGLVCFFVCISNSRSSRSSRRRRKIVFWELGFHKTKNLFHENLSKRGLGEGASEDGNKWKHEHGHAEEGSKHLDNDDNDNDDDDDDDDIKKNEVDRPKNVEK